MTLLERATGALAGSLRLQIGAGAFMAGRTDYVAERHDNLVPGVEPWMFEAELRRGQGSELVGRGKAPPKFHAAHSSAALAVNAFGPWKTAPQSLRLAGVSGFEQMAFEAPCDHGLGRRVPPTLDVLVSGPEGVVAVESKCTEMLRTKRAIFSPQYETLVDTLFEPKWLRVYRDLKDKANAYRHLDAAQLVKHYLGLRNTFPGRDVTLLYLFWEPANAAKLPEFRQHRAEVSAFGNLVAGSAIDFAAMSYLELWADWAIQDHPAWLGEHVVHLRARYEVTI